MRWRWLDEMEVVRTGWRWVDEMEVVRMGGRLVDGMNSENGMEVGGWDEVREWDGGGWMG